MHITTAVVKLECTIFLLLVEEERVRNTDYHIAYLDNRMPPACNSRSFDLDKNSVVIII